MTFVDIHIFMLYTAKKNLHNNTNTDFTNASHTIFIHSGK